MTDPIADMFIRIKNAYRASKATVSIPFSKIKSGIAEILKREGCISGISSGEKRFKEIILDLFYDSNQNPGIFDIKRVSKPGRRVYINKDHLPRMKNTFGFAIISTPQGLITGFEAKKRGVGGEIICKVLKKG